MVAKVLLHTHRLIESLACEPHLQVPLHRRCLPDCSYATPVTRDIETTFVCRLQPRLLGSSPSPLDYPPSLLPLGGGGSTSFSKIGTSVRSMLGTQTLLSMRQFIEDVEKEKGSLDAELEVMDSSEKEQKTSAQQDAIKALRMLFEDFETQKREKKEKIGCSSSCCLFFFGSCFCYLLVVLLYCGFVVLFWLFGQQQEPKKNTTKKQQTFFEMFCCLCRPFD